MKYLNAREKKAILSFLSERFEFSGSLEGGFFINNKDRLFYTTAHLTDIDMKTIRMNSLGMYFGFYKDQDLRLSIEGSQLIGPKSNKNILELTEEQTIAWLSGADLDIAYSPTGPVILKSGVDFIGCAKSNGEKLFNFVPKNRRVN